MKGCRRDWVLALSVSIFSLVTPHTVLAGDGASSSVSRTLYRGIVGIPSPGVDEKLSPVLPLAAIFKRQNEYQIKLAYGRTFGTSTELDYATLEVNRSLARSLSGFPLGAIATTELQLALLASYVVYYEGVIERVKRLNFQDGYELAWLPKTKISLPVCLLNVIPYMEGGAGMSYVSETYRNSGSRWNWSLLGAMGFEKSLSHGVVSLGFQWRHLSNGNMWGKGDELHNSNSGTDMIQAIATFVQRF